MSDPLQRVVSAYAAAFELLAAAVNGRTRRGPGGTVLALTGGPVPWMNVIISPHREPDPDEMASLAELESWDFPWSIHVRGMPGPLVTELAARYGLTEFERQALMVRPADQGLPGEMAVDSLRVRAVSEDELGLFAEAVAEGFESPPEIFGVLGVPPARNIDGVVGTSYLAELDGVVVGTGKTVVSGGLTAIFDVTTMPRYRRRGYGLAITLEMIRAGYAAGAPTVFLGAGSAESERLYARAGFRTEEYLTVITAPS
jgi:N-acetylglutamate synthase